MNVKVIKRTGQSAIVEYRDGEAARRVIVPGETIDDNGVADDVLALGVPYGLPWEHLLQLRVTPEQVADELRRRGIWTAEDLRRAPNVALAALQSAYGVDLAALLRAAEQLDKEISNV